MTSAGAPPTPVRGAPHSPAPFLQEVADGAALTATHVLGGLMLAVTIPDGTSAQIVLPRSAAARVGGRIETRMTSTRVTDGTPGHVLP